MKKRIFFAVDLPEKVKKKFAKFFANVYDIKEVKWEREKLHLTLIFLGFVDENKIPALTTALHSAVVKEVEVSLRIMPQVSVFPTLSNPRVLWLPVEGEVEKLKRVASALAKMLKRNGFPFDKRFSPHLTLGRFRNWVTKEEKDTTIERVKKALPKGPIEFTATGITLFKSKLTPSGSVYNILAYENFRH